jgi:hypothetical protein
MGMVLAEVRQSFLAEFAERFKQLPRFDFVARGLASAFLSGKISRLTREKLILLLGL